MKLSNEDKGLIQLELGPMIERGGPIKTTDALMLLRSRQCWSSLRAAATKYARRLINDSRWRDEVCARAKQNRAKLKDVDIRTFTIVCCDPDCPSTFTLTVAEHAEAATYSDQLCAQSREYSERIEAAGWVNDIYDVDDDGRASPDPHSRYAGPTLDDFTGRKPPPNWSPECEIWKCPFCVDATLTMFEYAVARGKGNIH